jgi:hypothetical protein
MKKLFFSLLIMVLLLVPMLVEAVTKDFILKYLNQQIELISVPSDFFSIYATTGLIPVIERIILLKYDEKEKLCLIEIHYRIGSGRDGRAIKIKKCWIDPLLIIFSE